MEIKNATTVHRIWKELPEAELMGAFQYETDARIYCRAAIESQPEGTFLALIDHYSGRMFCFHKAKVAEATS
jgi:hypothetical protein